MLTQKKKPTSKAIAETVPVANPELTALSVFNQLDFKLVPEQSYKFGGATYGYVRTYKASDYTLKVSFGRTLGGFGQRLQFQILFKDKVITETCEYGDKGEALAGILFKVLK